MPYIVTLPWINFCCQNFPSPSSRPQFNNWNKITVVKCEIFISHFYFRRDLDHAINVQQEQCPSSLLPTAEPQRSSPPEQRGFRQLRKPVLRQPQQLSYHAEQLLKHLPAKQQQPRFRATPSEQLPTLNRETTQVSNLESHQSKSTNIRLDVPSDSEDSGICVISNSKAGSSLRDSGISIEATGISIEATGINQSGIGNDPDSGISSLTDIRVSSRNSANTSSIMSSLPNNGFHSPPTNYSNINVFAARSRGYENPDYSDFALCDVDQTNGLQLVRVIFLLCFYLYNFWILISDFLIRPY